MSDFQQRNPTFASSSSATPAPMIGRTQRQAHHYPPVTTGMYPAETQRKPDLPTATEGINSGIVVEIMAMWVTPTSQSTLQTWLSSMIRSTEPPNVSNEANEDSESAYPIFGAKVVVTEGARGSENTTQRVSILLSREIQLFMAENFNDLDGPMTLSLRTDSALARFSYNTFASKYRDHLCGQFGYNVKLIDPSTFTNMNEFDKKYPNLRQHSNKGRSSSEHKAFRKRREAKDITDSTKHGQVQTWTETPLSWVTSALASHVKPGPISGSHAAPGSSTELVDISPLQLPPPAFLATCPDTSTEVIDFAYSKK